MEVTLENQSDFSSTKTIFEAQQHKLLFLFFKRKALSLPLVRICVFAQI